jgi:hypothetical protein
LRKVVVPTNLLSRLGILGMLAFLPALAQVPGVFPLQDAAAKIAPYQFGPIREKIEFRDGTATSPNWSGYVVLGSSFYWAAGSWVVPAADCSAVQGNQFAAFWVGLDGYTSSTVEQIGTLTDCDAKTPAYYAWYQFYPQGMTIIPSVPIAPGDHVSASVVYYSSINEFTVRFRDDTTGATFGTSAAVPGALRSSAEWIAEAPCCAANGGILPLTDFGTVTFGRDSTGVAGTNSAMDLGTRGLIGSFPAADTIVVSKTASSGSEATSTCSTLSADGTSFSCTWQGAGP